MACAIGVLLLGIVGVSTKSITIGSSKTLTSKSEKIQPVSEWIWYSGDHSATFTFKYPKDFFIHEYPGMSSVQVFASEKESRYNGDHLTITWSKHDERNPYSVVDDCEAFGKRMGETQDNTIGKDYKFRYVKQSQLSGYKACEYGISLVQVDHIEAGRMYEFSIDLAPNKFDYGLIGYAAKEAGLDVFHQIANTFLIK